MLNNKETGPSDQDADEMDYEGEQEYLDYLTAKTRLLQSQGLQVGLDDGTDANIDNNGASINNDDLKSKEHLTQLLPSRMHPMGMHEPQRR